MNHPVLNALVQVVSVLTVLIHIQLNQMENANKVQLATMVKFKTMENVQEAVILDFISKTEFVFSVDV